MIPVRLKMRNFLPYRGDIAPLSFKGVHMACISGDNGAGKSSIIDAMTWALWGKSRLRSKSTSEDDLITQGESETEVVFDFRAGDGQIYRVVRRRARPKRAGAQGQSTLALFLDSDEGFKTYSGNTISETESRIEKILHLDYETFQSSAYLKQGEADHFTGLTANQRKEVLVTILGLDIYDALAEKAKSRTSEAAAARNLLSTSIELEQQQLQRRPEVEAALEAAQGELADSEKSRKVKRAELETLRRNRQLLEARQQSLNQTEVAVLELEADLLERSADKAGAEQRVAGHRAMLDSRAAVEEGYARYVSARSADDDYNRKQSVLRQLEIRHRALETVVTQSRHALETRRAKWQAAYDELSARAAKAGDLRQRLDALRTEGEKLFAREQQLEDETKQLQALRVELAAVDAEKEGFARRLSELAEKTGMLASAGEASCPVCEAELREDRLKMVQAKYDAERKTIQSRLADLAAVRSDKSNEITALERHLALEHTIKAERSGVTAAEARLNQEFEDAEAAARRLPEGEKQIAAISRQLEDGDFCPDEQRAIKAIDEEIKGLGYDSQAHEKAAAEVKQLEPFERRHRELAEAARLLSSEETNLVRAAEAIAGLERRLKHRRQAVEAQRKELAGLPAVDVAYLAAAETEVERLSKAASAAAERVGSLKQNLQHLDELEKKLAAGAVELKRLAAEESLYKELQQAFGKGGIQAALIENAIPEMEAEANRLLARMTDNRMSIKLEVQRATKKGELIDTFDIKIGDELGTRDYDLFSGGEAFRINFALRLALSRLLAHRAGAPLRTLIIDEGFGTQDASGIEKLKEAIASIQDQFDCILVITHIEEFKDAFPARIEVFKTAEGSNIQVSYA